MDVSATDHMIDDMYQTQKDINNSRVKINVFAMISNTILEDAASLKHSLQDAVISCADRCLYQSAKWWVHSLCTSALESYDTSPGPRRC